MADTMSQNPSAAIQCEIDLGRHHLFLMSDQSIELMCEEQVPSVANTILSLDSCETYHLMISLQEMFREVSE